MSGPGEDRQKVERRKFPRTKSASAQQATIAIGGHPYEGDLVDYSFSGLGIQVASSVLSGAVRYHPEIELKIGDQQFFGSIRNIRSAHSTGFLGIALKDDADNDLISFSKDDSGWDLLDGAETLETLFSDVVLQGSRCPIEWRQKRASGTLIPEKIEAGVLVGSSEKGGTVFISSGPASFRFEVFQTCHAFDADVVGVDGGVIRVRLPKGVARLLRRETVRVPNDTNGQSLTFAAESRLLGSSDPGVAIRDYSEHGISIIDPTGRYAGPVGTKIEEITISTKSGAKIHGSGFITSLKPVEGDAFAIGVSFAAAKPEDRTLWHNTILEARYPTLLFNYQQEDHEPIWGLLDRSGYLGLKPRETFTHVFDATKQTWQRMSDAGTRYAKRALIKVEGKIVGHLQLDRIYPRTWCAHTLALDPGVSKTVARDIYAVAADVLLAEGAGFVFSLADSKKPWNQRNYYDFINQYRYKEHNEVRIFQVYEVDVTKSWSLKRDPAITLKMADSYDLRRIARYFELYETVLEREACGLAYDDLTLSAFNEELKPFGLFRTRDFVVAVKDGRMAGFARVEAGSTGVNIFGLLDMLYVYVMPDLGAEADAVHETLVDAGLQRMREIGRQDIIAALENRQVDHYNSHGLLHIFDGARWIGRIEVTKRYHAYSQMLYGHLLLRREQIHKRHR